jgi:hypothetical protein
LGGDLDVAELLEGEGFQVLIGLGGGGVGALSGGEGIGGVFSKCGGWGLQKQQEKGRQDEETGADREKRRAGRNVRKPTLVLGRVKTSR